MAISSSAKVKPKAIPKAIPKGKGVGETKASGTGAGTKGGKKVVKKRGKKGLERKELDHYLGDNRALTPVDSRSKEKKPKNVPLPHLSHLLRAEVNLFQHNQLNTLLVASCLPSEPTSNLKHCSITPGVLLAPEIRYVVSQHDQENNVQTGETEHQVLNVILEEGSMTQSIVKGHMFQWAEEKLMENYPTDGLDSDTAMDDDEDEEDGACAWPSETFKTLRWLTVQLMAFDDSLPCSWHNYYEGKCTEQEPTPNHLDRMLDRTNFSGNGAKLLEHVDKMIRGVLHAFCVEFVEEPLDVIPDWWSQSTRILDWKLKESTRGMLARFLFGSICMEPHPYQPENLSSTIKEPYALALKAQESRYATKLDRSVKGLHAAAMPYRESYLALAICARLASIETVRATIHDPESNLLRVLSKYVDGLVMTAKERKMRYRWSQDWVKKDADLSEDLKSMKTHSPEWHLYHLAQGCSLTAFDSTFEQRRSKISQALLGIILPLTTYEMINVFNKLNVDKVPLDVDFIAFHQHSFVKASEHVGKWIGKHPQVEKGETGLSLVWHFYKNAAAHIALIGNNLGPYVAWESLKLLEQYTTPEVTSTIASRAVGEDAASQILGPLHLYDETTRTLGVGDCQVSDQVIGHLLGFDSDEMHWPSLRKSDVGGVPGITPTRSQMLGAFSIISAIYADDLTATEFSRHNGKRNGVAQFLNDTVGMGKTLQAFMVITGLFNIRRLLAAHNDQVDLEDDANTLFPYITRRDRGFLANGQLPNSVDRETRQCISSYPTSPSEKADLRADKGLLRATSNRPVLIVVPKSVINQWQAEWTRFVDGSGIQWIRIESMTELRAKTKLLASIDGSKPTTIITTYPVVTAGWNHHSEHEEVLSPAESQATLFHLRYSCLIADEAHRCRNNTDESSAMQALSRNSSVRLFLSATAITNSVQDLVNVFKVMVHPAVIDDSEAEVWKKLEEQLKLSDTARKKYRNTVLASLSPADWYRHVQLPEPAETEGSALQFQVMEGATLDPDAIYTQSHFQDLLTQREKAHEAKKKSFSAEEDRTQLVALSKGYRQTYENLDAIALAQVLRQVGPSILRRGADSSVYLTPSFTPSGFLSADESTHRLEVVLPVYPVQRRRYNVLPDNKERELVTQLLIANQPIRTETAEEGEDDGADEEVAKLPIMSVRQRDAFHTLGRQASIFLKSAQYAGIPIEIVDGMSFITASAKIVKAVAICKAIIEEDKDKPDSEKRKICIFVRWTSGFPLIQYHLLQAGLGSICLNGSHSAEEREKIVQQVQQDRAHPIGASSKATRALKTDARTKGNSEIFDSHILILSEAGGEGLNLTRISELIILDGMWTAADANQLEGRFRRRGQKLPVNIHYLETPGTADEPMKLALQQKAMLYDITCIFGAHVVHDSIQTDTDSLLHHLNGHPAKEPSGISSPIAEPLLKDNVPRNDQTKQQEDDPAEKDSNGDRLSTSALRNFMDKDAVQSATGVADNEKALPDGWFNLNSMDDAIELFLSHVSFAKVRKHHAAISEANKKKKAAATALLKKKNDQYLEEYQKMLENEQHKDEESEGTNRDGTLGEPSHGRSPTSMKAPENDKECIIDPSLVEPPTTTSRTSFSSSSRQERAETPADVALSDNGSHTDLRDQGHPIIEGEVHTPRTNESRPLFFSQPSSSPAEYTRKSKSKNSAMLNTDDSDVELTPRASEPPRKRKKAARTSTGQHSYPSAPAYEDDFFSLMENSTSQ
ncbi:hypothetical protein QFC22_004720 [Naganishia vaughanmartiniae]|uniref:Uncharacterized protein n=1 Tax=Naganishia vaughanmartiniae TaxID=1424756 RepID=A0ACC2WYQ6_9TREE|nr:hypothetical protein QFC22_004720 [Naganishia vaughanmartiniae]